MTFDIIQISTLYMFRVRQVDQLFVTIRMSAYQAFFETNKKNDKKNL